MKRQDVDLDRVWLGVAGGVGATPPKPFERLLGRVLQSPALARALVTTPSLLLSWVLASAAVFVIGAVATFAAEFPVVPLIAPVLAAIGVAFAYGNGTDPAYELTRTLPTTSRMVLLVRLVAVFSINVLLGMAVSIFIPEAERLTTLWLIPMAAIALCALLVSTLVNSATVGSLVAMGVWIASLSPQLLEPRSPASTIEVVIGSRELAMYIPIAIGSAIALWWLNDERSSHTVRS